MTTFQNAVIEEQLKIYLILYISHIQISIFH